MVSPLKIMTVFVRLRGSAQVRSSLATGTATLLGRRRALNSSGAGQLSVRE
jgi:hypothetical protein